MANIQGPGRSSSVAEGIHWVKSWKFSGDNSQQHNWYSNQVSI